MSTPLGTPLAYPLSWPPTWPRTSSPRRSRFGEHTLDRSRRRLLAELDRLGASGVLLSTNLELRLDGWPRANQRPPADRGVAVYFTLKKRQQVLACDRWDRLEDNVHAIALHVAALRALERYGVGDVEQAFAGYKALPETAEASSSAHWSAVLGVEDTATLDEIKLAYRERAKLLHPDVGGSDHAMARLNQAFTEARAALRLTSALQAGLRS